MERLRLVGERKNFLMTIWVTLALFGASQVQAPGPNAERTLALPIVAKNIGSAPGMRAEEKATLCKMVPEQLELDLTDLKLIVKKANGECVSTGLTERCTNQCWALASRIVLMLENSASIVQQVSAAISSGSIGNEFKLVVDKALSEPAASTLRDNIVNIYKTYTDFLELLGVVSRLWQSPQASSLLKHAATLLAQIESVPETTPNDLRVVTPSTDLLMLTPAKQEELGRETALRKLQTLVLAYRNPFPITAADQPLQSSSTSAPNPTTKPPPNSSSSSADPGPAELLGDRRAKGKELVANSRVVLYYDDQAGSSREGRDEPNNSKDETWQ